MALDPTKAAKIERLSRAQERIRPLLEDSRQWENECEGVFSEFRVAVVHLRRDMEDLDAVQDKDMVWRFLCKLSRERRPFWGRCEEVLRSLMNSDEWMRAFAANPDANLNDLPTNVIKEFSSRVEEVGGRPQLHVRLAIIGCGAAAARHCIAMARHNERTRNDFFRVVALCDPVPTRVAELKELPGAAKLQLADAAEVHSVEALFDKVDFDTVAFLSHVHREGVLTELFARGKFVIAEPPLVPNAEAAARVVRLSRQEQPPMQRLLVAERGEYWPEVLEARERLAAGAVGEVLTADARAVSTGPAAADALAEGLGCVWSPGLRWLRALARLLGPVEEVCATKCEAVTAPPSPGDASPPTSSSRGRREGRRRSFVSAEACAACILRHRGGAVSTLQLRSCAAAPLPSTAAIVVSGVQGDVVVEDGAGRFGAEPPPVSSRASGSSRPSAGDASPGSCRSTGAPRPDALPGDDRLWELFASQVGPVVRNGESPLPEPTEVPEELQENLDAHLADLAAVQALQVSLETRRFEAVEPLPAPA